MRTPLISILMPVKNAGLFLEDCISSILNQTETRWELIAVNDESTDNSREILDSFAAKDDRIRVYNSYDSGIIPALRMAFSLSTGPLITRMDADDRMAPNKLRVLSQNLLNSGKGHIAIGQVKYFTDHGNIGDGYRKYENWLNGLTATGTNYSEVYKECVIPSPCWMVHRMELERCGAFNPDTYPEDYDLCFRFRKARLKPIPCKQVLHYWRDHPERTSRNDPNYADNTFLHLKLYWFLRSENPRRTIILWGAGSKGKRIAKELVTKEIPFYWVCDNPKKIGKEIYDQELLDITEGIFFGNFQVIVLTTKWKEAKGPLVEPDTPFHYFC